MFLLFSGHGSDEARYGCNASHGNTAAYDVWWHGRCNAWCKDATAATADAEPSERPVWCFVNTRRSVFVTCSDLKSVQSDQQCYPNVLFKEVVVGMVCFIFFFFFDSREKCESV